MQEKLTDMISNHQKWLHNDGGCRLILTGANLTGANLARANLARANLYGANLTGADLTGMKINNKPCTAPPAMICGLRWLVTISDAHIHIGCQTHSTTAWSRFKDDDIAKMDIHALEFWQQRKPAIIATAKAHQSKVKEIEANGNISS